MGNKGGGAGDVHLCWPPYKGTWIPYRWYWRITFLHRCSSDSLWTKTWTAMSRYQSSQRKRSRWMLQSHQAILQQWQVCVGRFHLLIRTGYHRQLHSAIPGIFREGAKKNPNLPQILQKVLWHWHWLWINVYNEGPRDLGSKLVLTLQTGEWIHLREYRAKHDFPPHLRPTPPHLTSVLAEQLLARACENEADNAKRMRMGMEPVSQVTKMADGWSFTQNWLRRQGTAFETTMISCSRCQCCQRSLLHLRAGLTSWSPCSPPRSTPRQVHLQVIHRTCCILRLFSLVITGQAPYRIGLKWF